MYCGPIRQMEAAIAAGLLPDPAGTDPGNLCLWREKNLIIRGGRTGAWPLDHEDCCTVESTGSSTVGLDTGNSQLVLIGHFFTERQGFFLQGTVSQDFSFDFNIGKKLCKKDIEDFPQHFSFHVKDIASLCVQYFRNEKVSREKLFSSEYFFFSI